MPRYLGLMSGTSLDGLDVAVVTFEGEQERPAASRLEAFRTVPYEEALRARLRAACAGEGAGAGGADLCALGFELGRRFAAAVREVLDALGLSPADVACIGSHGQTVWHDPPGEGPGSTLQIGEAAAIAEATGIPVVADFRVRDVAAGGQGAPLTAYFDRLLLSSETEARGIQNLGGMGNLTALPRRDGPGSPIAFDTGPGVALIDAAVHRLSGGREAFDAGGARAARGRVVEPALEAWLDDPFFETAPPRSTGRERFSEARLDAWLERHAQLPADDLVATLTELTARAVGRATRWVPFPLDAVFLCGGGARNLALVERIRARLDPVEVHTVESLGWDGEAREAAAFALLARQHHLGIPVDLGWATGARGPRRLGKWVPA